MFIVSDYLASAKKAKTAANTFSRQVRGTGPTGGHIAFLKELRNDQGGLRGVDASTKVDDRRGIRTLDQKRAATHLRGLLHAKEAPPLDANARPAKRRGKILIIGVIVAITAAGILGVAVQRYNDYLETQARLEKEYREAQARTEKERREAQARAEKERQEARARTEKADAGSWNLVARALLDDETTADADNDARSSSGQRTLRSPAQILKLHQVMLARRSGPAWQDVSPSQAENLRSIVANYVAAFESLQQSPGLESLLYGRGAMSITSNLAPAEAPDQLAATMRVSAAFTKINDSWAAMPKNAPKDHVTRILNLTASRKLLLEAEMSLLHYLVDNPRDWKPVRRADGVRVPTFSRPALQSRYRELLDIEARSSAALLQTLSQLVGPTLARQLKGLR